MRDDRLLIRKDSLTHMRALAVYVKENFLLHGSFLFSFFRFLTKMRFSQSTHLQMYLTLETNIHHKDWLTCSGGNDRPDELCIHFFISNNLNEILNFPTRISDCDSHSPAVRSYLFLLTLVFVLQWIALH